jgi:hypothetical protein
MWIAPPVVQRRNPHKVTGYGAKLDVDRERRLHFSGCYSAPFAIAARLSAATQSERYVPTAIRLILPEAAI